jgi:hypothetical protein
VIAGPSRRAVPLPTSEEGNMPRPAQTDRRSVAREYLLSSVQLITAFFILFLGIQSVTWAQATVEKTYVYDNSQGKLAIPLPAGTWQKVLEHETDEVIDMGTYAADWKKGNIFLIRRNAGVIDAIVTVNANISDIDGRSLSPPDFCFIQQRRWKWHKQVSTLKADTYCWGVNSARLPISAESEAEAWQLFMEKNAQSKWGLREEMAATQVRFLRWVSGRFMRIDYYFLDSKGGKPMDWKAARKWAEGLINKVKEGFEGG